MLDTNEFFNRLIEQKYTHLCVVPCSFAKNLINAAINNQKFIEYVPCASEAVACSVAAGLKMAGQSPIVIVQSSGLTNMASCITSLLVPYEISFPIITSWRSYKAGDSEIQHQHLAEKLPELISAYGYSHQILDQQNVDLAVSQINKAQNNKTICILKKETFSKVELGQKYRLDLSSKTPRSEYLKVLNETFRGEDVLFIGTTGNTAREMYSFMPDTDNFYMAGNMGGALSLGLGAAKGGKKVFVCGGDAEFVMHLGGLTTAGRYKDEIDLTYILFDNQSNKSTGGQNTYQDHVDYIGITKSSAFESVGGAIDGLMAFNSALHSNRTQSGARFLYVKCGFDEETPRPPLTSIKVNAFN